MKSRSALVTFLATLALCAGLGAPAGAQPAATLGPLQSPLWLRYPAISPDGQHIAFAFQGSIFVVPAVGGDARLLVGNGHHSSYPVWSPDGRRIAYASDVHGNLDVFIVAADGGPSRRLTTHSANETPLSFTPDGREVLFKAQRLDARTNVMFPSRATTELYKVSTEAGRRPVQLLTTPAMSARYNQAGSQMLYEDWKGYESEWRKHHVSPVARDVWLYDVATRQHRKLTGFGGEDRDPVWSADQKSAYYLSEQSGSFNVWQMPLDNPAGAVQVTRFEKNPVRFLSVATGGTLAFGYDGELYVLAPGAAAPAKVAVRIAADLRASSVETIRTSRGATEIAPSPDGQEIAFVVRGEVFVASTEFGDTRRITHSPALERSVSFSPDGKRLLFASERDGVWGLYEATVAGSAQASPYFFSAAGVQLKTLLKNAHDNFQPRYSPDGKEVAYLEDRVTLKVLNLASGQSRTVLPGSFNYSYADGDQWFDWSPDGRSLLVTFIDSNRWSQEVGLVDAAGKAPMVNLTKSGYEDALPLWTRGGQSMLWLSDRMGLHGQSGSGQKDVFALFFTRDAFDRYKLSKSEYAWLVKSEAEEKDKDKDKEESTSEDKKASGKPRGGTAGTDQAGPKDAPIKLPPPVKIEFENLEDRTARLTANSADIQAAAMSPDGETLFYVTSVADGYEVWAEHLRSKDLKKFASFPADPTGRDDGGNVDLRIDAKGETGFVMAGGAIQKFKLPKDDSVDVKAEGVEFNAEMRVDRAAERLQMFQHVWRQTAEKLYVKDMNGVDWNGYRQIYAKFLPFVADNTDFAELLSEMLGELNVSHTGSGYRARNPTGDATGSLGVFVDPAHAGAGLKITEIVDGGPLSNATSAVRAGMIVEKIDGTAIAPGMDYDTLLDQTAGKRIALDLLDPATGKRFNEIVKPVSRGEEGELLYRRWVKTQREMVDRLSGGQLGYVHVRSMDDPSYRDAYAEILGRNSGKQALIVDTRFNGGGNLTDDLATLLSGTRYLEFLPRGQHLGWEPSSKWIKPSLVVIGESNYSDAHLFPWVYRKLGIGKLLGMPVAGTGTAVWWETLLDDTLYFGIPQVGLRDERGIFMENALVEPDYLVPNDPALIAAGRDQQIEAAVRVLMQQP
jgi:tricorn protease